MDSHQNGQDALSSERPPSAMQQHQPLPQLRDDRMSGGLTPSSDDAPSANGEAMTAAGPATPQSDAYAQQVRNVLNSEIGVQTLLDRLKQSIATAKEFAFYLKKRSILEDEHANGLRKMSRMTHENLRRPEHRQDSFLMSFDDIARIHERMADNGNQFAGSLNQMHEDLLEMAARVERGRKHWKQTGLSAEQRLTDAESAMRKSKTKYDALAADYDRARMGDRQGGKMFGLKGKSGTQYEEELLRKVQAADAEYGSKVQSAQGVQAEILTGARPEAAKNLQVLIKECDSALTLQMQKFATFNEKLLLLNGMTVSPLKSQNNDQGAQPRSLREIVAAIDNDKDLSLLIGSQASKVPAKPAEIRYERNPVLNPSQPMMPAAQQSQFDPRPSTSSRQGTFPPQGSFPQQGPFPQQGSFPQQGPFPQQGSVPPQGPFPQQGPVPPQGPFPQQGPVPPQGPFPQQGQLQGPPQGFQYGASQGTPQGTPQRPYSGTQPNRPLQGHPLNQGPPSAVQPLLQQQPEEFQRGKPTWGGGARSLPYGNGPAGRTGPTHYNSGSIGTSDGRSGQSPLYGNGSVQQDGPTNYPSASIGPNGGPNGPPQGQKGPPPHSSQPLLSQQSPNGAPQLSALPFEESEKRQNGPQQISNLPSQTSQRDSNEPKQPASFQQPISNPSPPAASMAKMPYARPQRPVFGLSLDQLFERDNSAVPMVVNQCIQAVDLFGLGQDGIYRQSGNAQDVAKLKGMFDNDASKLDFRNPENFFHDVNSVAGLLKLFFRELLDPLLTAEHYMGFIDAAKIEDDIVRRDSLHAIINGLPDPNYATLRSLTLHLNRVMQKSAVNRMTSKNLAIVFGPTLMWPGQSLMGPGSGQELQPKVIETILNNCYQIFDDD